ncbi:MAG: T9SS type A sorting domain-containing protein [Prolixibacteraceae bacterium]|nr:T9SS type A sorting domain-containing protein [Prolixibacteraceae bacterium]
MKFRLLLVFFALFVFWQVQAESLLLSTRQPHQKVYAIFEDDFYRVPPPADFLLKSTTQAASNIVVKYNDFPNEARAAFEYAVSIWESLLYSGQTIQVEAHWLELEGDGNNVVLGAAGASNFYIGKSGLPNSKVFYNAPLAEKLVNDALNQAGTPDIYAYFNEKASWYFGTDGQTPAGKFDFVTIVLHELCHGLGFLGSMNITDDQQGIWSYGSHFPFSYDQFIVNGEGASLTNVNAFPNPSKALYTQITGNNLYFDGPVLRQRTGDRATLYAPETYDPGSSIDHLSRIYDQTENSLMTPGIRSGTSIHNPGNITMSIMDEVGWANIFIEHEPLKSQETLADLLVAAKIYPDFDTELMEPSLFYALGEGPYQSVLLMNSGIDSVYFASISLSSNAKVKYYISVKDRYGRTFFYPNTAPELPSLVVLGADTVSPQIVHLPDHYFFYGEKDLTLTCEVTDLMGVDSVFVEYWHNQKMKTPAKLGPLGKNKFGVMLNLEALELNEGDTLSYRIVANDLAMAANTGNHPANGYHQLVVTRIPDFVETLELGFESGANEWITEGFELAVAPGFSDPALHSEHPYLNGGSDTWLDFTAQLVFPIKIHDLYHFISFDEIVLVEPGEKGAAFGTDEFWDYVLVEGSKDGGETWIPFAEGWDCRLHPEWENAYNQSLYFNNFDILGEMDLYRRHQIDLTAPDEFAPGDVILIRFRLNSDPFATGWGWAIDNLKIQTVGLSSELAILPDYRVYPNPVSDGRFSIGGLNEPVRSLQLFDAMGKLVYQQKNVAMQEQIFVPNYQRGIHILYLEGEKSVYRTKLLFR